MLFWAIIFAVIALVSGVFGFGGVASAAAGVAAIFKAPATGAVFSIEVPYQDDLARRMLLPAMVASAMSSRR